MRILFISNYFPPYHIGGYEELCAEVAEGLTTRGHTISVLTTRPYKPISKIQEESNLKILRLLEPEVPSIPVYASLSFFLNYRSRIAKNSRILKNVLNQVKPQIIFVWGGWNLPRELFVTIEKIEDVIPVYYFADYWASLPSAYTLHWQEPGRRKATTILKRNLSKIAQKKNSQSTTTAIPKFDNSICVSNYVLRFLTSKGIIQNGIVIHNGINISDFQFKDIIEKQFNNKQPLHLLYAGRVVKEKGVETAIRCLSILNNIGANVNLTILGRGNKNYLDELNDLIFKLDIGQFVSFQIHVPREQLPKILRTFDMFLAPSIWEEPIPRSILEAMASGLVVIGSDIGGIPEIIQDRQNGLLAPPNDPEAWAESILYLINHPESFIRYAIAGRKTIEEKFTISKMLDKLENYLESLL